MLYVPYLFINRSPHSLFLYFIFYIIHNGSLLKVYFSVKEKTCSSKFCVVIKYVCIYVYIFVYICDLMYNIVIIGL